MAHYGFIMFSSVKPAVRILASSIVMMALEYPLMKREPPFKNCVKRPVTWENCSYRTTPNLEERYYHAQISEIAGEWKPTGKIIVYARRITELERTSALLRLRHPEKPSEPT